MGSLRLIGAALGVESKNIKWDKAKQTATLVRGNNTVSVTIGKKNITVNGKTVTMDTVAEMKQGRVFIPARFIAQGLGVRIGFDSKTSTVSFYTGNEVVNNNFADYGLTVINPLPVTLEVNGLAITYEEAFLYKADSAEAKAINEKYKLIELTYSKPTHLLWLKVTITNNSTKTINSNRLDIEPKIGGMNGMGASMALDIAANKEQWVLNGGDYLYNWSIEPGESIKGYVALAKVNSRDIDFISLETHHRDRNKSLRIAVKE